MSGVVGCRKRAPVSRSLLHADKHSLQASVNIYRPAMHVITLLHDRDDIEKGSMAVNLTPRTSSTLLTIRQRHQQLICRKA